jgi:hypothetical protein
MPDTLTACVIQPIGLDKRKRDVTVELRVVAEEDALLSTLAKETDNLVTAIAERRGLGARGRWNPR